MVKPVIPVLMSSIQRLENPVDIIKYVLYQYMSLPKNINDTFSEEEISFRWDDAQNGGDPELMRRAVQVRLEYIYRKYFPTAEVVDVTVSTTQIDEARYSIVISILITINGTPYSISDNYEVDKNNNLIVKFK